MWHVGAVLVLFTSLEAVLTGPERPACPQNRGCVFDEEKYVPDTNVFFYNLNGSESIQVKYTPQDKYYLRCNSPHKTSVNNADFPTLTEFDNVEVEIYDCLGPGNISYYDVLYSWKVTVTKKLNLREQYAEPKLQKHHLSGLEIYELEIKAADNSDPPRPSQDFLEGVKGLRTLKLDNVILDVESLMRLPDTLETLELKYAGVPAAASKLGNGSAWLERLHSLKSLFILESAVNEPLTLPKFNVSLPNLTKIKLNHVLLNSSSLAGTFDGSSVKDLQLFSCQLNILPDNLFEGANLTNLIINYDNLALPRSIFSPLQWLTELDLNDNNLDAATLIDAVSSLPQLQTLRANNNPMGTLCRDEDMDSTKSNWPKSLRHLELVNTKATRICPDWIDNDELMNIYLKDNDIGDLTYNELKMKRAVLEPVTLDLSNNPKLRVINVSSTDILQCRNDLSSLKDSKNRTRAKVKLKITSSDVKCSYGAFWLREALRNCPAWLVSDYNYGDSGELFCPYDGVCLEGCSCQNRARDNATVVNCTDALPPAPSWPPSSQAYPLALHVQPWTLAAVPRNNITLVELHAANNNISRLDEWDIADTLLILDVRNNSIQHISEKAARKLTAKGTSRSVQLKGNSLHCNCSDTPAYKLLGSSQVVSDWDELLCPDNIHVSEKMQSGLCFPDLILVVGLPCLVVFLLIIGLLLYNFQPQIRQVLFKLNYCRRYVFRVNDKNTEKEKDVFLSYYHDDLAPMNIIKNALEDRGYSTIEHNRDFNPGDPVLSQIMDSVKKARRTVVLLSNHFIESKWMLQEFRYAHAHALKHQTSKVIVIKYNLSQETTEMLPSDMTFYLKYNTYLDWHDEQFLENLYKGLGPPRFRVA